MMTTPSPTETPRLRTEINGAIGTLIVDNPKRLNAVTLQMWRDFPATIDRLDQDPAIRVIILRGAGDASFVAGADISEFAEVRKDAASGRAYEAINVAAFRAIRAVSKPTIAMIAGPCLGGGLGVAMSCDLRMAATSAVFGIPAARLGIGYPPDCMADLVNAVGASRAKEIFYTGRRIRADEALRIGLVTEVVADADLAGFVARIAATIAENAPLTIRAAKAAIDRLSHDTSEAGMARAIALADECFDSADFAEGRTAFLEKRAPIFTGE